MSEIAQKAEGQGALLRVGLAVPAFTLAIGLSAFLLFSIQPMFTKIVLPTLGGSPGVWSVAMVFFQAMLLAGYGYAHLLTTRLSPRHAALVHVGVMLAVVVVALPIGLTTVLGKPPADDATLWLLAVFTLSVGLPFFVVSAHGPLLQAWFARTGHAGAGDPYFLYAASNVGSLVALLSFPLIIEPLLPTRMQTGLWSFGFAFLIAAVALCAAFLPAGARALQTASAAQADADAAAPTLNERLTWCLLAFVPSGLLVAVTAHISTDVAAAPLLWVIPLSLFLLTFIITFQPRPWLSHRLMLLVQPGLVIAAYGLGSLLGGISVFLALALTLLAFFASAMVFHGELVRLRPAARHLTSFYVWMSIGGVLGGIFAGLLAPLMFDSVAEYGILFLAALAIRLSGCPRPSRNALLAASFGTVGGLCALLLALDPGVLAPKTLSNNLGLFAGCFAMAALLALAREARIMAIIVIVVGAVAVAHSQVRTDVVSMRSFFGVSKVRTSPDGTLRFLSHGTTLHGAQRLDQMAPGIRPDPLTYYFRGGPFDQAISAVRADKGGRLGNVAVIGLGTGSQACLSQAGENWRFYEIDPLVARVAQDPAMFTFMTACAPNAPVILGDARLMLHDAPAASYDLIIIDAFSSDAIPLHLVTREAMELYRSKLTAGGAMVFHVSNRNLSLAPFVAATAAELSLRTMQSRGSDLSKADQAAGKASTDLAVVSDNAALLADLPASHASGNWRSITPIPGSGVKPWTDDFSNIVQSAWMKFNERRKPQE